MPNDISEIIGKVLSESSKSYCHSELYHFAKTEGEFSQRKRNNRRNCLCIYKQ